MDSHLAKSGSWEPELIGVFKRHLNRGSTILDIGCNIGFHSLAIAAILNDDCQIHAFEPQTRLAEQFNKSVRQNSYRSITIHNVGLSNNNSFLKLQLYDGNIGASSFLVRDDNKRHEKIVEVKKLDDFDLTNCDFIKIDVEGFELFVFQGGMKLINKFRPKIVMEYSPQLLGIASNEGDEKLIDLLTQFGYKFYFFNEEKEWQVEASDLRSIEIQRDVLCINGV